MAAFIRIDNSIIRRRTEGITTLDDVGLFAMLSAFLSIPSFRTPTGGLQAAIAKHCRNGRHTIHAAWLHLCQAGYLKRVRLPDTQHYLRDLYTLHSRPDHTTPAVQHIGCRASVAIWNAHRSFTPPTEHYTPVSTAVLMDAGLSLAAKGLYAMIHQRLLLSASVGGVTLSREGLRRSSGLGECAFRKIWKELRSAQYLQLTHVWDPETKQMRYRYDLATTPGAQAPTTAAAAATVSSRHDQLQSMQTAESPAPAPLHTAISDTRLSPTAFSTPEPPAPARPATADGTTPSALTELVQDQIEYDVLLTRENPPPLLDCAVEVMTRIYHMPPNERITLRGATYPAHEVQRVLRALDANEAEYAIQTVRSVMTTAKEKGTPIKNLRGYLLACLFSAKTDFATSLLPDTPV